MADLTRRDALIAISSAALIGVAASAGLGAPAFAQGPSDDDLVQRAIAGDNLLVYGDGSQSRCFLHVADAVAAILAVCEQPDASGRAFNIGNPDPITILELARRVLELTGSDSGISLVPYEQAYGDGFEELGRRSPDITAVSELTGWRPQHTLDEALVDVVSFQRQPANARFAPVHA